MVSAAPSATDSMPSVIMNGGTLNRATPMPLIEPTTTPTPMPAIRPSTIAKVTASGEPARTWTMTSAETTLVRAMVDPTERSNPAVSRHTIWPIDTIAR